MEMRVDERRRYELTTGVERFPGGLCDLWRNFDDATVLDRNIDSAAAIGQIGIPDEQIDHVGSYD